MHRAKRHVTDFLVIGSGIAGLTFAIKASTLGSVIIVTKKKDIVLVDGTNKRILENKGYEHFKRRHL